MAIETQAWTTSDLGQATYLYCIGAQLQTVDRHDPRRSTFVFALNPAQAQALTLWQSGAAQVNALAFWAAYQAVKARLFRGEGEG